MTTNKPYRIDGDPCTASELIARAKQVDPNYAREFFCFTSTAANILRDHGHVVEHNTLENTEDQS